jgi:hypothetical protein
MARHQSRSGNISQCTPQALADLYDLLSDSDKQVFLRLISKMSTAEAPFLLMAELDPTELWRFAEMFFETVFWQVFPVMESEARRLARETPHLSDEEFSQTLHERIKTAMEQQETQMKLLHQAQFRETTSRTSKNVDLIRRNLEVCELRRRDPKTWTFENLKDRFGFADHSSIRDILKQEAKWRRLASKL